MVDLLTFQGTKNAGAAAANSLLGGLVYNSSPLTLTTTQQASLQGDANGYLKVNVAAGGAGGGAITAASGSYSSGALASGSIASGALATGSMVDLLTFQGTKAAGTAAANSLLVGGVYNSSPLTLTTGQQSSLQFDANGYAKVNVAAGGAGGGAITAAASSYSAGAFVAGAAVDGWDITQGAKADSVCGTATGTCSSI